MEIYKPGATRITLSGQTFTADENGIIDVPAQLVANAFTQGFVSAKARIKQLAGVDTLWGTRSDPAEPAPAPATEAHPVEIKPAPVKTTKPTEKN